MHLSFRAKLFAIVGTAAFALAALMVASFAMSTFVAERLTNIQNRYVPKLELGPRLQGNMERLKRSFQDAVAAKDAEGLLNAGAIKDQFLTQLDASVPALTLGQIAALRATMDDYFVAAADVSRRLIAGETGERVVEAMGAMQAKQARLEDLLVNVTSFDRGELARAFVEARQAQANMTKVRMVTTLACLLVVIMLSVWMGRGLIRSLAGVSDGLSRFGAGDFSRQIPIPNRDEIGEVAAKANQMAASLQRAEVARVRGDWIKAALAGLNQELRGELDPEELATRATRFIAQYVDAPIGALYYLLAGDDFELLGQYAAGGANEAGTGARKFRRGEGLVGEAVTSTQVRVIADPPADYFRVRSGLGEAAPRAIVLVPLEQLGRVRGVLELGLFGAWTDREREAVDLLRETLVIAIEVSLARVRTRELLAETQQQAVRLTHQEEELRAANEELQAGQEELRETNEELVKQAEELDKQRRELSTVSAYKSQFLANMSHELRTPLNSMLLLSNLLAENEARNLTDKQVEFARTIHIAGKDLLRLINQVLDLAKIEAGRHDVTVAPIPLRSVADHMRRVFSPLAQDKGLALIVEIAADVPDVLDTDGQRLEQVLNNLLGNAIKFTERGEVALRVTAVDGPPAGGGVRFTVSDTGLGIAAENQARIFVPFEQVDGAIDRRYGGTGLGLSISRELAELLGGALELESTLGKGSTFTLTLPRKWQPKPKDGPLKAASVPLPALEGGEGVLLVIEDDRTFADAFAEVIRGQGLECLVAYDGQTGLALARERRPAGIILDVKLPDIDGWRVMEELRFDPGTARIPVHFVTGVNAADRGMALGAVGYLTKPATRQDILRVIQSLIAPTEKAGNRVLVVEDDTLTSDSVTKQLEGEKFEVRRAMNAEEALAALERERFGCMVLDLSLPDMDGLVLLDKLRQRHGRQMPAVVIYTARSLSKAEVNALAVHSEAVVLKDGSSSQRLLDEVGLFTRRLKEGLRSRPPATAAPVHPTDLDLAGKKVLIAEDDMRTAFALSATLRAKGMDVHVADTGKAALDHLNDREDVDAVLMDIMMPEMDGYEAMRRIRKDPRFAKLPVVALTAKAMKGDQEKCLEAGATDYLPKPVDSNRLLAVLNSLLARKDEQRDR
jgi:CheY-like chemotaxis protein/signal transduction histidine kinase/HAMP domain-containing protein